MVINPYDEPVDPYQLARLLGACSIGTPVQHLDLAASTNDAALQAGEEGAPHGFTVVAEAQSAGRGRRGRTWRTPPGTAILASVLLRLGNASSPVGLLAGLGALAAAQATEQEARLPVKLKWPNDLILNERKLGGVLVEVRHTGTPDAFAIVGIGLNINAESEAMPADLRTAAISLREASGVAWDRTRLLAAVLCDLEALFGHWMTEPQRVVDAWKATELTLGHRVRAWLPDGNALDGIARDITLDGCLLLETSDHRRIVLSSGEVSLRYAALKKGKGG